MKWAPIGGFSQQFLIAVEPVRNLTEEQLVLASPWPWNLYGLQIRVGRGVSQNSQHRENLAFVVKCMSDDVQ